MLLGGDVRTTTTSFHILYSLFTNRPSFNAIWASGTKALVIKPATFKNLRYPFTLHENKDWNFISLRAQDEGKTTEIRERVKWYKQTVTPCNTDLLEKQRLAHRGKKFSTSYGTRRLITVFTKARHWSLPWARWIQSTTSYYLFKIHFNIIPISQLVSPLSLNTHRS
jgi:hypothetical protein